MDCINFWSKFYYPRCNKYFTRVKFILQISEYLAIEDYSNITK